jgi:hypothetical protein
MGRSEVESRNLIATVQLRLLMISDTHAAAASALECLRPDLLSIRSSIPPLLPMYPATTHVLGGIY